MWLFSEPFFLTLFHPFICPREILVPNYIENIFKEAYKIITLELDALGLFMRKFRLLNGFLICSFTAVSSCQLRLKMTIFIHPSSNSLTFSYLIKLDLTFNMLQSSSWSIESFHSFCSKPLQIDIFCQTKAKLRKYFCENKSRFALHGNTSSWSWYFFWFWHDWIWNKRRWMIYMRQFNNHFISLEIFN